jgi:hypothetical protein
MLRKSMHYYILCHPILMLISMRWCYLAISNSWIVMQCWNLDAWSALASIGHQRRAHKNVRKQHHEHHLSMLHVLKGATRTIVCVVWSGRCRCHA